MSSEIRPPHRGSASSSPTIDEPIAIVGIGCRFPGGVDGPDSFWRLLCNGGDTITEVPADRFDLESIYDSRPGTPGKIQSRHGGFLGQLDSFDAAFFGISPREAVRIDPQQRLLLEVGWEALEDAGINQERLPRSRSGVFIGMMANDYMELMQLHPKKLDLYGLNGGGRYGACGRISFCLGLEGPSLSVDTACSSSLVSIHLACQSLRTGECELALAGGSHVLLQPYTSIAISQGNVLAVDGRCKFGDARADGFVRGEGVALVALKPLARALADADRIYAVIRGSAVNSDGQSNGTMATPNPGTQEAMLREAYRRAGVPPGKVRYIEAHGTGTSVGDRVELQALAAVLSEGREPEKPCLVGSVKTNFGHTEGASGVAGLIKLALCLYHRAIPRSLHFHTPNPAIPWQEIPLVVQREMTPWPDDSGPAFGGVNSFGLSGTNAHVVLEEPPRGIAASPSVGVHLIPLSARHPAALRDLAAAWIDLPLNAEGPELADLAYTAALRRAHLEERLAVVASSREELREGLAAFLASAAFPGMARGRIAPEDRRKVVFVFPGQGSQWLGMGRELLAAESVFHESMERCAAAIAAETDWSLLEQLAAGESSLRLGEIDVVQPTLFAIQVSLAALWRSWGIEPDAVVGHSMGEVAAAHVAGALRLEDAARIICRRSRLLRRTSGQGEMAMVELTFGEAERALQGYENRLSVAVSNSYRSTVLAGEPAALAEVLHSLEARGVFCRRVKVDVASHSPQMDPLRQELLSALDGIAPRAARVAMYSTVEARRIDGPELTADYWVRNLRQPVRFATAVDHLVEEGHGLFLEISAHPILLPAIEQELRHLDRPGQVLGSLRRQEGERAALLGSLAVLYIAGVAVDWGALCREDGRLVALPRYPWQRERFWLDPAPDRNGAVGPRWSHEADHSLLGGPLESSLHPGTWFWEADLDLSRLPDLLDHQVRGLIFLPGAAYLEMTLAAARQAFGPGSHAVEEAVFTEALILPRNGFRTVQTVLAPAGAGVAEVNISSLREEGGKRSWTLHARARVRSAAPPVVAEDPPSLPEIRERCGDELPGAAHYRALRKRGLEYGAAFQGVDQVWCGKGEALGRLRWTAGGGQGWHVPPQLLDSAFQLVMPAAGLAGGGDTYLPVALGEMRLHAELPEDGELWGYVQVRDGEDGVLSGDVYVRDEAGTILLSAQGLRVRRMERGAEEIESWLHSVRWQRRPVSGEVPARGAGIWLLLVDGSGVGQGLAARLAACGETCLIATLEDDLAGLVERALSDPALPCRGVLFLRGLDAAVSAGEDASPEPVVLRVCEELTRLVQILAEAGRGPQPRLILVTRGAQRIADSEGPVALAQMPLWGLAAVIASEYPSLRCMRVDLDSASREDEADALFQEVWAADAEDQVALRQGERYVARLVQGLPEAPLQAARLETAGLLLRQDAGYLITGGLGGLGLEIAAWMAERGARHLVLVGRRGPSEEAKRRIEILAAAGAEVRVVQADVSRREEVKALIASFGRDLPSLGGVVHAAGLLDDGTLSQMDRERFERVMAPKVAGAWHLHTSTRNRPLDFFVLFSSVAALLGSAGQGNYAAANAFLDGLAQERVRLGLPALSVAWGAWAEVGLAAARSNRGERLAGRGLGSIPPALGPLALERLLVRGTTLAVVTPFDIEAWRRSSPAASSPLLSELGGEAAGEEAPQAQAPTDRFLDLLAAAPPGQRYELLVKRVCERVGGVLKLAPAQVDVSRPLRMLGFDSLMLLELRNGLEIDLDLTLSASVLWNHSSVSALAGHLAEQVEPGPPDAVSPAAVPFAAPASQVSSLDRLLPEVQRLSDEDALAALLRGRIQA